MTDTTFRPERVLVQDSHLSVRAKNALAKKGVVTIDQCASLSEEQLLKFKNLGKKTVQEILHYILSCNCENEHVSAGQAENDTRYLKYVLATPISMAAFSVRAKNILDALGVKYFKDLVVLSERRVLKQKNSGKKTVCEIKCFLKQLDLNFEMELSPELTEAMTSFVPDVSSTQEFFESFKRAFPEKALVFNAKRTGIPDREKYEHCYALYREKGTLSSVAEVMGITRERVRQILVKGTRHGLFNYRRHEYPYISKEDLLSALRNEPVPKRVAKQFNVSEDYVKRLLVTYGISFNNLEQLRLEKRKKQAIEEYMAIKEELGHYPNTTELQYNKKWRPLSVRMARYWGPIDRFREEFDIPKPPLGNPKILEHLKDWREQRSKLALMKRMQRLDDVRDCLSNGMALSTAEISDRCKVKYNQVGRYINALIACGEIIREGNGKQTKYRIAK